jgi:hypothetical protein
MAQHRESSRQPQSKDIKVILPYQSIFALAKSANMKVAEQ